MNYVPLQQDPTAASPKGSTLSTTDPLLKNLSEKVLRFVLILSTTSSSSERIIDLLMDTVPVTIQGIVYKKINYFSNKNYIYLSLLVLKFELN